MSSENRYLHLVRSDCPLPAGTHVVAYCRDSGGDEQDRSVTQQVDTAREYCEHHGLILEHIYIDEAKLSSNTEKRDALKDMLSDLRQRFRRINDRYRREKISQEEPFGVVFWKSNRLGRDSIEASNIKTDLRLRGITILDLVTSANTGNAGIDALIEAFQQWQDEQLLDEISQNAKRGLAQLVATRDNDPEFLKYNPDWESTGAYLGVKPGGTPRGFMSVDIQIGVYARKKGRNSGEPRIVQRMVPNPEEWERCRLAWEMRHNGASFREIHYATQLYKAIPHYTSFFRNRIYTGDLEYGGKLYENFVPALIPREWFEEEQVRRKARAQKRKGQRIDPMEEPRRKGNNYLLSGFVVCGYKDGEEHPMHIESIPAKKGKRGNYVFFACSIMKNSRRQLCQSGRLSLKALDAAFIELMMKQILTRANLRPLAETLAKSLHERNRDVDIRLLTIEAKLVEARKSLVNIMDAIENMGYAPHLQQRYEARKAEKEQLVREKEQLRKLLIKPARVDKISNENLDQWIDEAREALQKNNNLLGRRILQQFVSKIVIKEKTGTLYYSFPYDERIVMSSIQKVDLVPI